MTQSATERETLIRDGLEADTADAVAQIVFNKHFRVMGAG